MLHEALNWVSRLLINYILLYHEQTPAIVHKEDRQDYIDALAKSRKQQSTEALRNFLEAQKIRFFDKQTETLGSAGGDEQHYPRYYEEPVATSQQVYYFQSVKSLLYTSKARMGF